MRALRPDKTCLAALQATLRLWRDDPAKIPVVSMQAVSALSLAARAERLVASLLALGIRAEIVASTARVGGGAAPTYELESRALRVETASPDALLSALRAGEPPVVARAGTGAVLLDLRAVAEADDEALGAAVARAVRPSGA
jgi:L-seryl-tRNA(Ser) seleniumtransferase